MPVGKWNSLNRAEALYIGNVHVCPYKKQEEEVTNEIIPLLASERTSRNKWIYSGRQETNK